MTRQRTTPRAMPRGTTAKNRGGTRRGVSSVLAMMFLVIFGSLAAAMAVVAQGNLRTADSMLKVSRAMSAAETGLVFAAHRLKSEGSRFVVEKGVIDFGYGEQLWQGTYVESDTGVVDVLPPDGYADGAAPDGIVQAVRNAHLVDSHSVVVEAGDASLPAIDPVTYTLYARPIALDTTETGDPDPDGAYFRLRYSYLPLGVYGDPDTAYVRVTSTGVDRSLSRTLNMDFAIAKRIEYAVISPNRIMIGKNVLVRGPLGSRYGLVAGELVPENGDPLVMRTDFRYLDVALDAILDTFYDEIVDHDVDGDGRLRTGHPVESAGVGADGIEDYDGNEYVDDFDLFLAFYDDDGDKRVCFDEALAADAGLGSLTAEFTGIDDQLARLIDQFNPDRDGDGLEGTASDRQLGYNDGVLDELDLYAKLTGHVAFAVARADWEAAHGGSYQTVVQGPTVPKKEQAPVEFEKDDERLLEITTDMLNDGLNWLDGESQTGADFATQVAAGGTYTPPDVDSWESVPYDAPGYYDFYQRGKYEGYTFNNLRIPPGTNALFENCIFKGATYIETEVNCIHENWNYAGARKRVGSEGSYTYELTFEGLYAQLEGDEVQDTKVISNNIRFHSCTFLGSVSGDKPNEYAHWRNKAQFTGDTRFYLDPEDEDVPPALVSELESISEADRAQLAKSSILMPGWSIDVGNFTNDPNAVVKLKGTIIAGVLDIRGTADVHGTLMMTFRPVEGAGPLYYGGMTDVFNTTIGYFGPLDGDNEGMDPNDPDFPGFGQISLRYDENALLPDGIPWPISVEVQPSSYWEGGS